MLEVKGYWKNYIDGAWVDGGAGKIDVINPGTVSNTHLTLPTSDLV